LEINKKLKNYLKKNIMTRNLTLNPRRIGLLLKKEVLFENKKLLIGMGGFFVLLSLIMLSSIASRGGNFANWNVHGFWYSTFLIMGGLFYTSTAFGELNDKLERASYLSLPASHLEKFTTKWILTFIGFPLLFTLVYFIFSLIVSILSNAYYGASVAPLSLFGSEVSLGLKSYLSAQAIFLLAAIAFRKYEFFKLSITLFGLFIAFSFFMGIVFRIVFADFFSGEFMGNMNLMPSENVEKFIEGPLVTALKYLVSIGLPIFFWVVGYLKLTEKEV